MSNNILKEHGAITRMAAHFHLTRDTIRKHLTGRVCTWQTAEILAYAKEHYTFNADVNQGKPASVNR